MRVQTINALRAPLAEQGVMAPSAPAYVGPLAAITDGGDGMLPVAVYGLAPLLLDQVSEPARNIAGLDSDRRKRVTP